MLSPHRESKSENIFAIDSEKTHLRRSKMSDSLNMMYMDDIAATNKVLLDAVSQDDPIVHMLICRSFVDASALTDLLRRHARTLRCLDIEEISFSGVENQKDANCMFETIFEALGGATGLERLAILTSRDAACRITRTDLLVNTMQLMPKLANVQFCSVFTSEVDLNAAIDSLHKVSQLILHYEDAGSIQTLDAVTALVSLSFDSFTSIEIAGCPGMFKDSEANIKFCDALIKCDDLEYVCICENDLDEGNTNAMRNAFEASKARKVIISTSQRSGHRPVPSDNVLAHGLFPK